MAQVLDGLKSLSAEEALGEAGSVERVEGELAARRIQAAWRAKGARREVEGLRKAEEKRQDAAAALIQKRYKEVKRAKSATVGKAGAPDDYAARPARALSRRVSALRPPSQAVLERVTAAIDYRVKERMLAESDERFPTPEEQDMVAAWLDKTRKEEEEEEGGVASERAKTKWRLAASRATSSKDDASDMPLWKVHAEATAAQVGRDAERLYEQFVSSRAAARETAARAEASRNAANALLASLKRTPKSLEDLDVNAAPKSFTKGMSAARWRAALAGHKAAMAAATSDVWSMFEDSEHCARKPERWEDAICRKQAAKLIAADAAERMPRLAAANKEGGTAEADTAQPIAVPIAEQTVE